MRGKDSISVLLPIPDEEGVRQTKAIYQERFGREISDEEAMAVLGRVMRFQYLSSELAKERATEAEGLDQG